MSYTKNTIMSQADERRKEQLKNAQTQEEQTQESSTERRTRPRSSSLVQKQEHQVSITKDDLANLSKNSQETLLQAGTSRGVQHARVFHQGEQFGFLTEHIRLEGELVEQLAIGLTNLHTEAYNQLTPQNIKPIAGNQELVPMLQQAEGEYKTSIFG